MRKTSWVVALIAGLTSATAAQKPPAPELASLLAAAGTYLDGYAQRFGAVTGEERAHEIAAIGSYGGRTIRSDIVLIAAGAATWVAFRDAFEVDGAPLRPRDTRLVDALSGPSAAAFDAARRINDEGAKHHVGTQTLNRAINAPMLALMFLARANQSRSDFTFDGMKTIDRVQVALVTFKERGKPHVLPSADDATGEGRFWIEPGSGRVLQTELSMKSTGRTVFGDFKATSAAKITVRYAEQTALGLSLPVRLDEEYEVLSQAPQQGAAKSPSSTQTITGRADYSSFRRLDINVAAIVRK